MCAYYVPTICFFLIFFFFQKIYPTPLPLPPSNFSTQAPSRRVCVFPFLPFPTTSTTPAISSPTPNQIITYDKQIEKKKELFFPPSYPIFDVYDDASVKLFQPTKRQLHRSSSNPACFQRNNDNGRDVCS